MSEETAEFSACGVGFTVSRQAEASHAVVRDTLAALACQEHRGACGVDQLSSDGAGVMLDIPFSLLGYQPGSIAVASILAPQDSQEAATAFRVFEETFAFFGLQVLEYREVPANPDVLGAHARNTMPTLRQAIIQKPPFVHSDDAFATLLYRARQMTRTKEREAGIYKQFFFASLSSTTVVYKALTLAADLQRFYPDLQDPLFVSRFGMFHRRFSTNTQTSWDKAQPFRLIAHNGEINTISGNRAWAYSREQALGVPVDELLTHRGMSDSGNLNEMVEALRYRGSIPYIGDVLSIMIPPAKLPNDLHVLWSRAMEPWDGPAFVTYCDEEVVGARLDRNGFRPCRWAMTNDRFYLSSEAGSFELASEEIESSGTLQAGSGVSVNLRNGEVDLYDMARSVARQGVTVDPRLIPLTSKDRNPVNRVRERQEVFGYTEEDLKVLLLPMAADGKEAIGSMGNTARLAVFSDQPRPIYDYFFQNFAQVTNPPVDYIRERAVTDLRMYLGRTPNVFAPKELIPPFAGIALDSPVLSIAQMTELSGLEYISPFRSRLAAKRIPCCFPRSEGPAGLEKRLAAIGDEAVEAVQEGYTVLVLSDEEAQYETPAVPMLLAVSSVTRALDRRGLRLRASLAVCTAEVRSSHQLACLIGFGAAAVCPYLAIATVRESEDKSLSDLAPDQREDNLLTGFRTGLLRVMSKSGISVARSYHGSKLFTCFGLGEEITERYFPNHRSPVGGISFERLTREILENCRMPTEEGKLPNTYQFKEQSKGKEGERHSMTVLQSRQLHALVRSDVSEEEQRQLYQDYLELTESYYPVSLRHVFSLRQSPGTAEVEPIEAIMKRFGSGAMSFGAISAESQRDIFHAMHAVGGRSNSGEGGENPYYWVDGTTASIKQVASARFGVTGQYLISANEVQIKIAQGAKPGEGGQLMREKVDEQIARARHASPGIDLISPPPLHDIYSIEDLKELIYELKQFNPACKVNVKLVAGANIGTIAAGVAKAGADSIHISGGDGGTGAAAVTSMKHAGLPWEIGLIETHTTLLQHGLRDCVELRVDGGLSTGRDIVIAAILGAEGFDFGKLLLVAEGCIMARLCQTNTCPVGIATHAERFKKKYKGQKEHVVSLLRWIARDVQDNLAACGAARLSELAGRTELLEIDQRFASLLAERGVVFDKLLQGVGPIAEEKNPLAVVTVGELNERIRNDLDITGAAPQERSYQIRPMNRAVPATLCGDIARERHKRHLAALRGEESTESYAPNIKLHFSGSAGQGFAMLLEEGMELVLHGEANDSVCKSMSGGVVAVHSEIKAKGDQRPALIGNCALYGATGGALFVAGAAGDRFGVRNSGAKSVVEGVGLHGCEYMTSGLVAVLGATGDNFGAGMTGGKVFLLDALEDKINQSYIRPEKPSKEDLQELQELLLAHLESTQSDQASLLLDAWPEHCERFTLWVPR